MPAAVPARTRQLDDGLARTAVPKRLSEPLGDLARAQTAMLAIKKRKKIVIADLEAAVPA